MDHPPEPSATECNDNARVADFQGCPTFASWYPQMGGYSSKCVVVIRPEDSGPRAPGLELGPCFDAPQQFIVFGQAVRKMAGLPG